MFFSNNASYNANEIELLISHLKNDKVVGFPTDTVYALGANPESAQAIELLYTIKSRDPQKPISILARNIEHIINTIDCSSEIVAKIILTERLWPGYVTFVIKSNHYKLVAKNNKLGFRFPAMKLTQSILDLYGKPIAATSLNVSGEPCAIERETIPKNIEEQCYILSANIKCRGVASTVLDVSSPKSIILRVGALSADEVKKIWDDV